MREFLARDLTQASERVMIARRKEMGHPPYRMRHVVGWGPSFYLRKRSDYKPHAKNNEAR
jgi:hypothetical protein